MKHYLFVLFLISIFSINPLSASNIQGKVTDAKTGEELPGATIVIKQTSKGTSSGLDGSFLLRNIQEGTYTLTCSYISYNSSEATITLGKDQTLTVNFKLQPVSTTLEQVIISASGVKNTELSARQTEKNAVQVMNVISARTIELSPDMDMSNVVQRMSGITIDKSSSSSGQYALLRGMDKRYTYTLVNGIKIPSTHNKHRYITLDMFPSDIVERVEVTKALTADMEADAVSGVVNMIMKNAPDQLLIQTNIATGYNMFFANNAFHTFSTSSLNPYSPYERNEKGYRATPTDFPTDNLIVKNVNFPINYNGNLSLGNRFFNKKIGWIVSLGIQNVYTGENNLYFKDDLSRDGLNLPILKDMQERVYSEKKTNTGLHNKLDYSLNRSNSFSLYTAYLATERTQIRETQKTDMVTSYDPENGNLNRSFHSRHRYNHQNLFTSTLQGSHQITKDFNAQWSVVYSKAANRTPDEATITYGNSLENFQPVRQYVDFDGSTRIWRKNSDQDQAAYVNFTYKPNWGSLKPEIKFGGLFRDKKRSSFYNKYVLNAIVSVQQADTSYVSFFSEKGVHWNSYQDIVWSVYNPRGTVAVGENYDASEKVAASFAMISLNLEKLNITSGIRYEHTRQGYYMLFPIGEPHPSGEQVFPEFLPSLHLKYNVTPNQNIRLSYYKALNKPGFQEIVPYIDASEEPVTAGNKNLKHAVANNIDLRWEWFPSGLDQIMCGLFYKHIKDPIEFAFDKFMNVSQNIVYTPINSEKAINYGIELDVVKYFRQWGIRGNYTRTQSSITTTKLSRVKGSQGNDSTAYVSQTRPLYGQSANVGNISLLYKGINNGVNGQIAFSYVGDKIFTISRFIDNDLWQDGAWQLDASAEKNFNNGISLFVKAHNLLNTHLKVYIKKTNPLNYDVPFNDENQAHTLVRDEYSMPSFFLGFRYKL